MIDWHLFPYCWENLIHFVQKLDPFWLMRGNNCHIQCNKCKSDNHSFGNCWCYKASSYGETISSHAEHDRSVGHVCVCVCCDKYRSMLSPVEMHRFDLSCSHSPIASVVVVVVVDCQTSVAQDASRWSSSSVVTVVVIVGYMIWNALHSFRESWCDWGRESNHSIWLTDWVTDRPTDLSNSNTLIRQ